MADLDRPAPAPDLDDQFFWDALGDRLMLPLCADCSFVWLRPSPSCPRCGSANLQVDSFSGQGTVYSWVVIHRALDAAFAPDVPYTVLTVDLAAGARIVGRLLGPAEPYAGMPVQLEVEALDGVRVPAFRPRSAGAGP